MSRMTQPSYQPDSLLMTKSPETSVNMSRKARGSFGSVGSPGLGSRTTRMVPMVGKSPFGPVAVGLVPSFIPGIVVVKMLG